MAVEGISTVLVPVIAMGLKKAWWKGQGNKSVQIARAELHFPDSV